MRRLTRNIHNSVYLAQKVEISKASPVHNCRNLSITAHKKQPYLQQLHPLDCTSSAKETIFAHLIEGSTAVQQIRKYAPINSLIKGTVECWNCNKVAEPSQHMICALCGYLLDINKNINYFDLMNLPKSFNIETQELSKRFRQLQSLVHPDKFSKRHEREQLNSVEWSSYVNKAYKTLLTPIERGQYMLKLHGQQLPEDNSALNKEFLMEMMERNEAVEEAITKNDLEQLNAQLVKELIEKSQQLNTNFNENQLNAAIATIVEMKYLLSIQNSIKNKLEKMLIY